VTLATVVAGCSGSSGSSPAASSGAGSSGGDRARSAAGDAVPRFTTARQLADAMVAAVRAKGSVEIVGKASGVSVTRDVQVVSGGENALLRVSIPGRADQVMLIAGGSPYSPVTKDQMGKHWLPLTFADLEGTQTWASAALTVGLIGELESFGLATGFRGGDAVTTTATGDQVRTYTLTLGAAAAAAQVRMDRVPANERAAFQQQLAKTVEDVTVVLGADNLPRTESAVPGGGSGGTATVTTVFSRWGQVKVPAPAESDIVRP
jgi:hypothetical protein